MKKGCICGRNREDYLDALRVFYSKTHTILVKNIRKINFTRESLIFKNCVNIGDVMSIKEQYDNGIKELWVFLNAKTTWRDLTTEEFKEKSKLFKGMLVLSELAKRDSLYSENKLQKELQQIHIAIKRLLL